jgi:hypothetical protein
MRFAMPLSLGLETPESHKERRYRFDLRTELAGRYPCNGYNPIFQEKFPTFCGFFWAAPGVGQEYLDLVGFTTQLHFLGNLSRFYKKRMESIIGHFLAKVG